MSASRSWRPAAQHHCPAAADLPHRKHLHSMIRILLRSSLVTKEVTSSPARGTSHPRLSLFTLASRWPILVLLLALLLSAGSVVGLTRLHPDARVDLLIDPNAAAFKDQALFADTFGADPVVVMAKPAAGSTLITPEHIVGLSHLEGKLHLAAGVKKVYGPGTLVNTLAISTTTILLKACADEGKAAEATARQQAVAAGKSSAQQDQAAQQAFQQAVSACAQRYAKAFPSLGVPAVNNPTFIQGVLLEPDGQHVRPFWSWALPVVLGLSADYLIQSANRVMESAGSMEERLTLAARRILPTTGLAAAATAAGMLAFVASGIPLVRQFGLFMALGVLLAYLANYLVGLPLLLLLGRRFPRVFDGGGFRAAAGRRLARIGTLAPAAALAIVVIGLAGWAALPSIKIETDPAQLVPANDPALAQAASVRKEI